MFPKVSDFVLLEYAGLVIAHLRVQYVKFPGGGVDKARAVRSLTAPLIAVEHNQLETSGKGCDHGNQCYMFVQGPLNRF